MAARGGLLAAGLAICLLARGIAPCLPVIATVVLWTLPDLAGARRIRLAEALPALALAALPCAAWLAAAGSDAGFADGHAAWEWSQIGLAGADAWRYYGKTLPWFAFPAWLLALWWIAKRRPPRLLDVHPVPLLQRLPLVAIACALGALAFSPRAGESVLLPLLPPLALLIAPGQPFLSRGQAALTDWFGRISFTIAALLVWLGYLAMMIDWPPRVAANFARLEPGFAASLHGPALAIALVASLAWTVAIARSERTPLRAIVHWCYGSTLTWLLLMTLWLPWIDYGRSYRGVAQSMHASMAAAARGTDACVHAVNLGLAERASFAYFGRVRFTGRGAPCPWQLAQGTRGAPPSPPAGARLAWEGHRPGDRDELFRLYRSNR
jgi:4-amino-4-deoxy-L-arabinose transferase-like glycosyltransferase